MAVNVKYHHEYKPTQSGHYIVNLCDADFSGSSTAIEMASTPFTLNWQNDDPHARVISSECNLNFICETQAQVDWFTEVASSSTGTYTVEILKGEDDSLFWAGVIQAESVTIPYLTPPLVINVQANDDLARLADSFHNQTGLEGGTPYSPGGQLGHVHLRRALSRVRTFHHWENADILVEVIEYYETSASGHGLTLLQVLTEAWDTSEEGGDNSAVTDLDVLEQFCIIFNCRLLLEGGRFKMHNLSTFETATNFEADLRVIYKGGTTAILQPTPNLETSFDDIQKYGGWATTFVPALKSVRIKSSGGFFASWGGVGYIPHQNQWLGLSGQNFLNTDNYNNSTGGFPLYPGNIPGGTAFLAIHQGETSLAQIHPQIGFDAFTLNNGGQSNVIRVKCTIMVRGELLGAGQNNADRWASRTATFDPVNTMPILTESGSTIEVPSVTYSDVTWSSTSTARLVWYSQPIDCSGNNARQIYEAVNIVLPAYDTAAASGSYLAPHMGGRIDVVKANGDPLSASDQTTIDNAFFIGVFAGPRIFSSAAGNLISEDTQQAMFSATQQTGDFRENLDLGTSHFGVGTNSPAYFLQTNGGSQQDFTSLGNTDGTDWILQLIVKDVLRLRSLPRKLFTGTGIADNTNTFSFSRIYTDNGTRYALLGASLNGGTNISSLTFFELSRDASVTISDTDIKDVVPGTVVPVGGGEVDSDNDSGSNFEHWFEAVGSEQGSSTHDFTVSRVMKKEERRMIRQRVLENGTMKAIALDVTDTSTPGFIVYQAHDGLGDESRNGTKLIAPGNASNTETVALPNVPAGNAEYLMAYSVKASVGSFKQMAAYTLSNENQVLQVGRSGSAAVLQWATLSASGGGFSVISGIRTFKGTGPKWVSLVGTAMTTDGTSAVVNYACLHAGTVGAFVLYSALNASTSFSMRLYKNGTLTETETFTIATDASATGTFSTSVSAGDILRFQLAPVGSANGSMNLQVQLNTT